MAIDAAEVERVFEVRVVRFWWQWMQPCSSSRPLLRLATAAFAAERLLGRKGRNAAEGADAQATEHEGDLRTRLAIMFIAVDLAPCTNASQVS